MKVLVLGQGGREHAIVRELRKSKAVTALHVLPGNSGMTQEAVCHLTSDVTEARIAKLLTQEAFDLVVIGPEAYLANGVSDFIRSQGVPVFGPSLEASNLESSKIFAKQFMEAEGIPTARARVVESVAEVMEALGEFEPPYILKADGLAAGKGVFICRDREELLSAARSIFEENSLGEAGRRALLEAHLKGIEVSVMGLVSQGEWQSLPIAQDFKRLKEKDQGPNTGGMGALAPIHLDSTLNDIMRRDIIQPTLRGIESRGMLYRGVLYIGIMVTPSGPQVLEYNVRFGDPEAQVLLPLVHGDWAEIFAGVAKGTLPEVKIKNQLHTACVVLAAPGYPSHPQKGVCIKGDPWSQSEHSYFLHAGTYRDHDQWVTAGGRVLNAIGVGATRNEAISRAYEQAQKVSWEGLQFRRDIK